MKIKHVPLLFLIGLFSLIFYISVLSAGTVKRIQSWPVSQEVAAVLPDIPQDLTPTLPAPVLLPEPEYTWGWENTVYWNADSLNSSLRSQNLNIVYFEVEARFGETILWGYVKGSADSATFIGLPEGVKIAYRLRYVAQNDLKEYAMSGWSDPEESIQDVRAPVLSLDQSGIIDLQESGNVKWVVGQTLQLRVVASDSLFGKVMMVAIRESSSSADDTMFYDLQIPAVHVDEVIPYTMLTPEKEPLALSWWVYDVAGQQSEKDAETLFWWLDEQEKGKIVCFPNPFNPNRGEISVIKIDLPGFTEAQIFDPFGNLVKVLKKETQSKFFEWDGKNQRGDVVSNGGYVFVVKGNERLYCKIAVLK